MQQQLPYLAWKKHQIFGIPIALNFENQMAKSLIFSPIRNFGIMFFYRG